MKKERIGIFIIGTSNVVIPGNRQGFPPEYQQKSRLHYYGTLFNSVELNSTFYKIPQPGTFEKWTNEVPGNFKFSVKLWKGITHVKELKFNPDDVTCFLNAADRLGNNKGCLLIQFPGKVTFDYFSRVEALLEQIHEAHKWNIVVEFRHSSWYTGETNELLDQYKASFVLHDIPKGKNNDLNKKAAVAYIRFHGPTGDYRGSYDDNVLLNQAALISNWLKKGKDVYAYFNNTIGDAFQNARRLQSLVAENQPAVSHNK